MTCFIARLARWTSIVSIAALAGASMLMSFAARSEETKPDAALIAKGEYLARAGDCIACHTAPEGKTLRRWPRNADAVRHALHVQHHAGPRDGHRDVDRRPVLRDDAYRTLS